MYVIDIKEREEGDLKQAIQQVLSKNNYNWISAARNAFSPFCVQDILDVLYDDVKDLDTYRISAFKNKIGEVGALIEYTMSDVCLDYKEQYLINWHRDRSHHIVSKINLLLSHFERYKQDMNQAVSNMEEKTKTISNNIDHEEWLKQQGAGSYKILLRKCEELNLPCRYIICDVEKLIRSMKQMNSCIKIACHH